MRFSEFKQYQPKQNANVFAFVCEDDFLLEESRPVWQRIFGGGNWVFEKFPAKEFEEIPNARIMEDALTPSLFTQNRAIIVTNAEKTTKSRLECLTDLVSMPQASLRVILGTHSRKPIESWGKLFPIIEIEPLKPADVARWLVERHKLSPEIARHLIDSVGLDLFQLNSEVQKLQTYVGGKRPIEAQDVDVLILRSERFGPFEMDDALLARDYKKAVQVMGSMLDEGVDPLIILARIARVWRQLFVGKSLVGKTSARDVATAAMVPAWKAPEFAASCKRFEWPKLAGGFRLLLDADRAFKTSTPNAEGYFDIMLWKMMS